MKISPMKSALRTVTTAALFVAALFVTVTAQAQTATDGDCRSAGTGNWSDTSKWQTRVSGNWVAASSAPTSANNVYIQSGHTITVDSSTVACKDLHVHSSGALTIGGNTLQVSGKWRAYKTAAANTTLGADGTFYSAQVNETNPSGITST